MFTPTYNRAYIIEKLYRSLQAQTYTDFEWLVIDDGSSDHTQELFAAWMSEPNPFPIVYHKVGNGGKHRAINRAAELARGELFFIVDSDDHITEDALECLADWVEGLEDKALFCGVSGNRGKHKGDVLGSTFDGVYVDATALERNQQNILGDKAEAFYTNVLKRYKFDEIEGETFITEATVWNRMAHDGLKIRWFNETICICHYLEDGLTKNADRLFANNPKGTAIYVKQQIVHYGLGFKDRLVHYYSYYETVRSKIGMFEAARNLNISSVELMLSLCLAKGKRWLTGKRKETGYEG